MRPLLIILLSVLFAPFYGDEKETSDIKEKQEKWWFNDVAEAREEANNKGRLLLVLFFSDESAFCERVADELKKEKLGDTAERVVPLKFRELDDYSLQQKWMLHTPPVVILVEPKSEKVIARLEELEELGNASEWVRRVLTTEKEMKELRERLKERPDDAETLYLLAKIELLRGLKDEAQTRFERVLKADKENRKGYAIKAATELLFIYFEKKRRSDVQSTASKIKDWDKENRSGYCDDADFVVAKTVQFLDKIKGAAKRRWKEFLEKYPESEYRAEALLCLGLLEYAEGNREDAKKCWKDAIKTASEGTVAKRAKGFIENMNIPTLKKKGEEKERPSESGE